MWKPEAMPEAIPDQHGRTILVTGANSGLGLRTAEVLAGAGATVLLACRNPARAEAALESISSIATGDAPRTIALDLADLESVAAAAAEVAKIVDRLDVLVNNAGIMAVPRSLTKQGFESQFGVNHLGHFALTGRLLPTLLAAPAARVVTVSSNAHRLGKMHWDDLAAEAGYSRWPRYAQSKLANLLFTTELNRQAGIHHTFLIAVAAHPGYAATNLNANGPSDKGARRLTSMMTSLSDRVFAQSDAAGARPQIHAATATDVVGNDYFGPDGPMEQRGRGVKRVLRTGRAADGEAAATLWKVSEELTDVTYDWPDPS